MKYERVLILIPFCLASCITESPVVDTAEYSRTSHNHVDQAAVHSKREDASVWYDGDAQYFTRDEFERYERDHGIDTTWLEPKDSESPQHRRFLILTGKPSFESLMEVRLDRETEQLRSWSAGAKVSCSQWPTPDESIFTNKVRNHRSWCRIKITIVRRWPDSSPAELEFAELKWKDGPSKSNKAQQAGTSGDDNAPN